ncbi:MAG: hypothetical protein CLLPBCKN_003369 [Chroococcidiopsis cubana SAG 39.79]|uniref:Uncharacterized protein n=1 Tax=Chroococcidiopsis cubana SAG 39.79 TaxID=388085 RepID=A0AB37UI61_9CYAN|nr:hypothetical protein [Chroococcidiopsis cubana]MDZ4873973.1 hypothetical protein [Chroococcidiopsis cubana SAG 39.79]PSB57270.1 hypothetical protein C7B79_31140 [Chroococcidiopsis cubana CCALA 043]RUT11067.1 hypothetical protein DSM107010_37010 [Chroococcidiopsis cubana SAG 39.79]
MTPEEIYQQALEHQRQLDEAEANYRAYQAKVLPYETYQSILRFFENNKRCKPRETCVSRIGEVACYHPDTKEFALYTWLDYQNAKNYGWKVISDDLNFAIARFHVPTEEQYQLTDADIPAYPYHKPPYR